MPQTKPHLTSPPLASINTHFHCKRNPNKALLLMSLTKPSDQKYPPYQLTHVSMRVLTNFDIPRPAKKAQGKKCNSASCSITLPCIADRSMATADVVAAHGFVRSGTTSCRDGSAGAPPDDAPQPPPSQSYESGNPNLRR